MAILIFLKDARGNALVAKDKVGNVEIKLREIEGKKLGDYEHNSLIVFDGFHGGKIIIMNPFENVTHILEQKDKDVIENQRKAEERQKAAERQASGGSGLVDPVGMFPGKRGGQH